MKLIIDIPEMAYDAYKEWHKNKVATIEQSLIANGIPYEERPQDEAIEEAIKGIDEILEENDIMGDVYLTERMMKALKFAQEALKKAAQNDKLFHVEHTTKGEE